MKNILSRGGIEFIAVFLGLGLSLFVDDSRSMNKAIEENNITLKRLYDNLELDSISCEWNYGAHKASAEAGNYVNSWVMSGQPESDSININLSRIAISTVFLNNSEEYNTLKSSGGISLIKSEKLISALHGYYSKVDFVKDLDNDLNSWSLNQFIPFMSEFCTYYTWLKESNVYKRYYLTFILKKNPPKDKLTFLISHKGWWSTGQAQNYKDILNRVTSLRNMIREELAL